MTNFKTTLQELDTILKEFKLPNEAVNKLIELENACAIADEAVHNHVHQGMANLSAERSRQIIDTHLHDIQMSKMFKPVDAEF